MSLINQVLKDLERRHAIGTAHRNRILDGLRPVAMQQGSRTARVLAVVLLSGAAVLWLVQGRDQALDMHGTDASAHAPDAKGEYVEQASVPMPKTVTTLAQSVKAAVREGQRQNEFDISVRPMPESPTPSDAEQHAPTELAEQGVAMLPTVSDERAAESGDTVALKSSTYAAAARSDSKGVSGRPRSQRKGKHAEGLPARDLQPAAADILKTSAADSAGRAASSPKKAELHVEKRLRQPSAAERADAIYFEGTEKLRARQRPMAEARWREALVLDAGHLKAREALAGLLIAEGRGGEAGVLLDEGLHVAPAHALFAKLRARLLVDEGNVAKALEVLERYQATPATDPEYHAFQAALYQRTGRYDQAVAAYQRALTERPQESVWWMGLAIALEGAGNSRGALGAYRQALGRGPLAPELVRYIEGRIVALEQRQVDG